MGNQFRWKEEPGLGEQQQPSSNSERRPFRPEQRAQRVTALLLLLLLVAAWFLTQQAGEQAQRQRQENIQDMLEQARQSVLAGDGERFFSLFTANAAWRAAQLQPVNQLLFRAGARVQSLSHYPGVRQADVTWADGSQTWQRTLFFAQTEDGWRIAPPEVGYWGQQQQRAMPWGTLVYYRLDEPWAEAIAKFASSLHAELCAAGCAAERLTLVVANGYGETAVPHTLHIPSPRLVALDETGQPGAPFWEMLHQRLEAYFLPVTIRFALPPTELPGVHLVYYDQAAADFMAANPGITIELIKLESLPDDLGELAQYDGAAIKPTAAMISAGLVHDLTNLAITDPFFDSADFYERIWQGAIWQDRLWFLPQTAAIPLIFYDKNAFQQAQQLEPMLFWTWNELTALQETVVAAQPETSFISWSTMDANRDLLFSYAFHQQKGCTAVSPQTTTDGRHRLTTRPAVPPAAFPCGSPALVQPDGRKRPHARFQPAYRSRTGAGSNKLAVGPPPGCYLDSRSRFFMSIISCLTQLAWFLSPVQTASKALRPCTLTAILSAHTVNGR